MAKQTQRDYFKVKAFTEGLRSLVASLPTEAEKQDIQAKLTQIADFARNLDATLGALPSKEEAKGIAATIQTLEDFALRAKNNPVLSAVMGFKEARPPRARPPALTDAEMEGAKRSLQDLQRLRIDELRSSLEDERLHSTRQLQAIASLVGLKPNPKIGRASLIHQIGTKIANYRGYQNLSGEVNKTKGPTEQP